MTAKLGWIRKFHTPASAGCPPLVIFPHAGSGASAYRAFSQAFSRDFDVIVLQYPGRQDRAAEPMPAALPEVAAGALAEFLESPWHRGVPVTVFGHSMGSMVGFEFVRQAEAAGVPVQLMLASGAVAPSRAADMPPHPTENDDELLDHMVSLNGTGAEVAANRDIIRMALPALRADYRAFDVYSCAPDVRVDARLHALGGTDDEHVTPYELRLWARHSAHEVPVTLFDGGHFYLHDHVAAIADLAAAAVAGVR
ncbi:thioesterase II family protein [Nocardia stercoris]|uniref:Thioesterase TesA n=1 Tax=Nocardia stercoris TaxID=2483361 RepID=A0A3M2KTU4_9NOCA|nr:alpha/beta fold hydrolase [Nocardia stercoris]RMI28374.1 thioesterase [Nocardia stercoris]